MFLSHYYYECAAVVWNQRNTAILRKVQRAAKDVYHLQKLACPLNDTNKYKYTNFNLHINRTSQEAL